MKINELTEKRSNIISQIDTLLAEELNDEKRAQVASLEKEYEKLGNDIETLKKQAERSKTHNVSVVTESTNDKSLGERWVDAFKTYAQTGVIVSEFRGTQNGMVVPNELRTDPILTTTNTGIINKTVAPLSVKVPAGLEWLRAQGVTFDENLNGNYPLPSLSAVTVGFVAEGSDTPSATVDTPTNTLAVRLLGANQVISRQTLAQTNADILKGILNGIDLKMGAEIARDAYVQIKTDFAQCKQAAAMLAPDYARMLALDSSIKVSMVNPVYAMSKSTKNYLKQVNAGGASIKFVIDDNDTINGIPVFAHPDISTNSIFLYDAPDLHVGFWGPSEIIVDNFTSKKSGKIEYQVLRQVDSGYANPMSLCWYDCSVVW
jgi:HK97 family phage major capsid protein